MAELYEFDLVFALPEDRHDAYELSDAVYAAGFDDAVVGTGQAGCLGVSLELEGEDPTNVILEAARAILPMLPKGSSLREIRPDLVSLADVAKKLNVKRQALQKRKMPAPAVAGFYRVTEIERVLAEQLELKTPKTRRARFSLGGAESWFAAGRGAQSINAHLALGTLDPESLEMTQIPAVPRSSKDTRIARKAAIGSNA